MTEPENRVYYLLYTKNGTNICEIIKGEDEATNRLGEFDWDDEVYFFNDIWDRKTQKPAGTYPEDTTFVVYTDGGKTTWKKFETEAEAFAAFSDPSEDIHVFNITEDDSEI